MNTTHQHDQVRRRQRTAVDSRTFSPAQIVAVIIGLVLLVTAGVAVARTGLDSLTGDTAAVFGIEHTLLAGLIELGAGLLFLAAAMSPLGARGGLIALGVAAIAFGAVVTIEPDPFASRLGDAQQLGVASLAIGLISLAAALLSPTIITERTVSDREFDREDVGTVVERDPEDADAP